jgi:GT2 family glycosyltransferase
MPLFSTIIPTFNRRDLLQRTLQSVVAEGAEPQIIVVDDGSTDGTLEMLAGYGPRITVLRQSNRGPGAARNLGLTAATGEYVAFLDSDDLWFPWTLATYQQVIEQHNRPAFIVARPFRFSDESTLPSAKQEPLSILEFADYYASGDEWRWYGVSSFIIRRDALTAAGGFTDGAVNSEDADLALKLGDAPGFVQITAPATFAYREHPGNLTANTAKHFAGLSMLIDHEANARYPGGAARRSQRHRIITRHTRAGSNQLLAAGSPSQAWTIYRRTFTWNLGQHRWRYLLAFPIIILSRMVRKTTGH